MSYHMISHMAFLIILTLTTSQSQIKQYKLEVRLNDLFDTFGTFGLDWEEMFFQIRFYGKLGVVHVMI